MTVLNLSAEEVLTTTRAVRKRLDFDRPVPRELIEDCVQTAQQSPTRSNVQPGGFVVVTDPDRKRQVAEYYRKGWDTYYPIAQDAHGDALADETQLASIPRVIESAQYLNDNIEKAPALVIPYVRNRTDQDTSVALQGLIWGSILPSAWHFCLAARERGLGTCWTTMHLFYEREVAGVLGIPYDDVQQVALIPLAFYTGETFKPAPKLPLDQVLHWDSW